MNGDIVPKSAKSASDTFSFGSAIRALEQRARSHYDSFKRINELSSQGICDKCGNDTIIEYHHVKPIWAFCLEFVLQKYPQSPRELVRLQFSNEIDFNGVNNINNLVKLCRKCHGKVESRTRKYWMKYLFRNYDNVVFGRFNFKQIEQIINKNNQ